MTLNWQPYDFKATLIRPKLNKKCLPNDFPPNPEFGPNDGQFRKEMSFTPLVLKYLESRGVVFQFDARKIISSR